MRQIKGHWFALLLKTIIDQLRPGQFVQARLVLNSNDQQRYLIPRKSIVRIDHKTMIFYETKKVLRR